MISSADKNAINQLKRSLKTVFASAESSYINQGAYNHHLRNLEELENLFNRVGKSMPQRNAVFAVGDKVDVDDEYARHAKMLKGTITKVIPKGSSFHYEVKLDNGRTRIFMEAHLMDYNKPPRGVTWQKSLDRDTSMGTISSISPTIKGQCDNCRCIIKEDVGRCPDCNKKLNFTTKQRESIGNGLYIGDKIKRNGRVYEITRKFPNGDIELVDPNDQGYRTSTHIQRISSRDVVKAASTNPYQVAHDKWEKLSFDQRVALMRRAGFTSTKIMAWSADDEFSELTEDGQRKVMSVMGISHKSAPELCACSLKDRKLGHDNHCNNCGHKIADG